VSNGNRHAIISVILPSFTRELRGIRSNISSKNYKTERNVGRNVDVRIATIAREAMIDGHVLAD
jgi:hypothetical protein